jgi:hypothetical protein
LKGSLYRFTFVFTKNGDSLTITARELAEAAIKIRRQLTVDEYSTESHRVAVVHGLEEPEAVQCLGTYLVGAGFTRAVRTSLRIADEFLNMSPDQEGVIREAVSTVVGIDNTVDYAFKTDQRDPWIAEGIGHLALWISRRQPILAARGRLRALRPLHVQSKEQGIDLAGLFTHDDALGITIGEAKASQSNATSHMADAASFFSAIDAGDPIREVQIRDVVQLLRETLRPRYQSLVTPALWEENRCYFPVVAYGNASSFSPGRTRKTYRNLSPGIQGVLMVCLCLENYEGFFDDVSNAMRAAL